MRPCIQISHANKFVRLPVSNSYMKIMLNYLSKTKKKKDYRFIEIYYLCVENDSQMVTRLRATQQILPYLYPHLNVKSFVTWFAYSINIVLKM